MSTGDNPTYNTKSPQTPGDLFALHQSFDGFLAIADSAEWPDDVKKVVTDSLGADISRIEASIVAELQAQMQAGKVDPGGVSFQGVNYTVQNGQLIVETIPDASSLTLLTTPFGGTTTGTPTANPPASTMTGGTGTDTTTAGTGTDTTAGGTGSGTDAATVVGGIGVDTSPSGAGTDTAAGATGTDTPPGAAGP